MQPYTYEQFYKIAVRLLYTKVENTQKPIEHHGRPRAAIGSFLSKFQWPPTFQTRIRKR